MPSDATVICLTPVKNEAWIIERFLQCAATWADHIVIADQRSDDGSREIAQQHEKVILVDNPGETWDERLRQNLLIDTARSLPVEGKRIFIALDADEALTANWMTSPEWEMVTSLEPGTIFGFKWVNVMPGFKRAWLPPTDKWFGFVDDGSEHNPILIHGPRLPEPEGAPRVMLEEIKVLHFQYTDWERMRSKQRWYQAWEHLNFDKKRPITIFRQYNHMYGIPEEQIRFMKPEWLEGYETAGIDMRNVEKEEEYRWDETVLDMLEAHGPERFSKIDIWDIDWREVARKQGRDGQLEQYEDPRSTPERTIHEWLRKTQPQSQAITVRTIQKMLQLMGW